MSGFCAVPRMNGRSGESARPRWAAHERLRHERPQIVVGERLDRVQLVRGSEAVEEMHERHPRLERRGLRDEREVVRLLDRGGGKQGEPGLADRHHVGVVAEDREPLRRERAGSDVQHRRRQLTGDLVHVRDHQQQALGGRERRRERAALQRAVQRAGGSALALHLDDRGNVAPHVRRAPGSTTRRRARPSATTE